MQERPAIGIPLCHEFLMAGDALLALLLVLAKYPAPVWLLIPDNKQLRAGITPNFKIPNLIGIGRP